MTTLSALPYTLDTRPVAQIGLIVLQSDETIEFEFRKLIPQQVELFVSRIPSAPEVSAETLAAMEAQLASAARLFPQSAQFASVGYGCTSGTAQIGADVISTIVANTIPTRSITNPLSALIAACRSLNIRRLGILSPYVAEVSETLRKSLASADIQTPVFASFDIPEEAKVVRVDAQSVSNGAHTLAAMNGIDALFLSCTNLRTVPVLRSLTDELGLPVLSSNQVLAWHLLNQAGLTPHNALFGALDGVAIADT